MKVGDVIDTTYELKRALGEGEFGPTFEAIDQRLGRTVVLKALPRLAADAELVEEVLHDVRVIGGCGSEFVVAVLAAEPGTAEGGVPYLVMEHVDGVELLAMMQREKRPIEPRRAVTLGLQVCRGASAAHQRGVLHLGLRPDKLMLARRAAGGERLKILDFGLARRRDLRAGVPFYSAPELLQDTQEVDHRADVYSTGVILYELLTGKVPFQAESFDDLLVLIATTNPRPPRKLRPNLNEELERVVLRAIAREADQRFENMAALIAALTPFAGAGAEAPEPSAAARAPAAALQRADGAPAPAAPAPAPAEPPRVSAPSTPPQAGPAPQPPRVGAPDGPPVYVPSPSAPAPAPAEPPRVSAPSTPPQAGPAPQPPRVGAPDGPPAYVPSAPAPAPEPPPRAERSRSTATPEPEPAPAPEGAELDIDALTARLQRPMVSSRGEPGTSPRPPSPQPQLRASERAVMEAPAPSAAVASARPPAPASARELAPDAEPVEIPKRRSALVPTLVVVVLLSLAGAVGLYATQDRRGRGAEAVATAPTQRAAAPSPAQQPPTAPAPAVSPQPPPAPPAPEPAPVPDNPWVAITRSDQAPLILGISSDRLPAAIRGFRPAAGVKAPSYAFELQRHEVTWGELRQWLAGRPRVTVTPPAWASAAEATLLPATGVAWGTARDYCESLGGALPTEAEWELAARGEGRRPNPWGSDAIDLARTHAFRPGAPLSKVMTSPQDVTPGAPEAALHDLAGNALEWTADLYRDDHLEAPAEVAGRVLRAIRGLPPGEAPPADIQREAAAYRGAACAEGDCTGLPVAALEHVGFRCVRRPAGALVEPPPEVEPRPTRRGRRVGPIAPNPY